MSWTSHPLEDVSDPLLHAVTACWGKKEPFLKCSKPQCSTLDLLLTCIYKRLQQHTYFSVWLQTAYQHIIIPMNNFKMPLLQLSSELKQARIITGFLMIYTTILCVVLHSQGTYIMYILFGSLFNICFFILCFWSYM